MGLDHQGAASTESPVPRRPREDTSALSAPRLEEEKAELERVLAYPGISRSANLVRFLSFICNKYFDGEAEDIRERTVAIEALGRKESSFDSNADPIVRVTARELRKKLTEFYENGGKGHPVQIVLPVGRYIPQFVRVEQPLPAESANPAFAAGPAPAALPAVGSAVSGAQAGVETPRSVSSFFDGIRRGGVPKYAGLALLVAAIFLAGYWIGRRPSISSTADDAQPVAWGEPVWSDNFDGPAQQLPDSSKWTYDTGNQAGWGNHELETYCAPRGENPKECDPRRPNAFLDGSGHLVLRAEKNANGVWTSARITTRGLKDFQYGRIEARMKLPVGAGLWPSFWMLGSDFPTIGWPAAGSLDLVENVSSPRADSLGPSTIRSTLHGPRYSGGNGLWRDFRLPNGARVDDGSFHVYGVIWSPSMIQFYVDDPSNIFFVQYASDIPPGGEWVFDRPFSLVMNLAVGGDWPGDPDSTTPNPAEMLVDYVRVYKIPHVPAPSIQWEPVSVKAGSAAASILRLHAKSSAGRVYLSCSTEPATAVCSLATSVLDFSGNLSQEDSLTLSTDSVTEKGRVVAAPGDYKVTITATTISGDRSQLTQAFSVTSGG